jgi:tetratricopeptide (TPR) repeat protein
MQVLPESQWGTVVTNYRELYPNVQNYTDQLRALEQARTAQPNEPALRFLLGFQYGYLGYPAQAVKELDQATKLQPKDLGSFKLRNIFAAKAGLPTVAVPAATAQAAAPATAPAAAPATAAGSPPMPAVRAP